MSQQLLSFNCRMWRDTSISSSTFLISLTNCCHHFLAPGVLMIGGEVCSTPKEATRASRRCPWATTSPSCPARRRMKVLFRRQQDYTIIHRLYRKQYHGFRVCYQISNIAKIANISNIANITIITKGFR